MRTEVVARSGGRRPLSTVRVRFLQVQHAPSRRPTADGFVPADALDVDGDAVGGVGRGRRARDRPGARSTLLPLPDAPSRRRSAWPATSRPSRWSEPTGRSSGASCATAEAGRRASIRVSTAWAAGPTPLVVQSPSRSPTPARGAATGRRPGRGAGPVAGRACTRCSRCDDGSFVSLLDPPDCGARGGGRLRATTARSRCCRRRRATTHVVLSSPIILYDHPAVAPESAGRPLRRHRDRRDPGAARPDAHRRREGRGPRRPIPAPRRSSTGATTCRPRSGSACTVPSARLAIRDRRHADETDARRPRGAAVVGSRRRRERRPLDRHHVGRRGGGRQGHAAFVCAPPGEPTPTTSSSPAARPPSPGCSATSTAPSTWPSPSTTIRPSSCSSGRAGYLYFHPDEVEVLA